MKHTLAVLLPLLLPLAAHAGVGITEIAWMGASDNANAEWIELYNSGSDSVPLAGWKITSSTGSPNITLNGTIGAGAYYLLTRTSTSIIPGVTGDQAYTGALSNAGATLTLVDASGASIDAVVGGNNWESIGGNNTTKETPQRTSSGTWVTAAPTPKAATASGSGTTTPSGSGTATSSAPSVSIGGTTITVAPDPPVAQLYIHAGGDRIINTHAEEPFEALVYSRDGSIHKGLSITWSFGDGTQEMGEAVHHAYAHPGIYLVVVRTQDGRARTITPLTVVVKDADVLLESTKEGVAVTNTGDDILDMSNWSLEAEGTFRLPKDTAILPGSRIIFAPAVTGLSAGGSVTLSYPNGERVAVADVPEEAPVAVAAAPLPPAPVPTVSVVPPSVPPTVAAVAVSEPLPSWPTPFLDLLARFMSR